MKTMTLPGFTAEASLHRIPSSYRTKGVHKSPRSSGGIVPQLRIPVSPGCGDCTPLRWPDGTPTGACASLLRCIGTVLDGDMPMWKRRPLRRRLGSGDHVVKKVDRGRGGEKT